MRHPIVVHAARALVVAAALVLPACRDSRFPKTYPVTGRVLLDGNPVHGVTVQLIPKNASNFKMDERPRGITDEAGNFVLSTYYKGDGAPAGEYGVAIAYDRPGDGDEESRVARRPPVVIPKVYHTPQQSGLRATVEKNTNELPTFELSSKGPRP